MKKVTRLLVTAGVATVAVLAVACGNGEAATVPTPEATAPPAAAVAPAPSSAGVQPAAPASPPAVSVQPNVAPSPPAPAVSVPQTGAPVAPAARSEGIPQPPTVEPAPAALGGIAVTGVPAVNPIGVSLLQTASGQAGIWVSGQGKITLEPDLAMLNLGVEANAKTVAEARGQAATAMDAIVASLTANGVELRDIQTRHFNISPQYEWTEVIQNGVRTNRQVLVGYRVSNSVAVKIRDLDAVGTIIDDVATGGGDATRINGISFTVEDTAPLMVDLREDAVADALAKAGQFARLTGVSLGRLVFISETGTGQPQVSDFREMGVSMAMAAPAPSTSISGGELEISLTVQAVFAIQ